MCPDGNGPFPSVIFIAGSGPTDRDWCSPILPASNGSARLLAESFADAGIASLRYDKRASGPHTMENAGKLSEKMGMKSHLNELIAAVTELSRQDFVDSARIVGLGHSEGTLHVLHYVTTAHDVPFAGIILAAPPGRPIQTVLISQLALQAQIIDDTEFMSEVHDAAARYSSGQQMDLDPSLPDNVKMALAGFEAPANLPFARELWIESASDSLAKVQIPTLVLIGTKDLQVDVHANGTPLQEAAAGMANVTFCFPADANHVFKEDRRSQTDTAASPGSGYNEPDTHLDPESLETIPNWLAVNGMSA
ncbi:alpha/beta fold hydrolase [Arthrobacter sp. AL08]|uniref:alpha/beta hydrolase family protein n=1 Tax=Pseudarthrobacter sp. PH31-O2 TaxID=3046206 RepID=UPI00249AF49A|nr:MULTISPECIES: alpha/beta fold hydrolase [Micrococcaceae]MDI3241381.1 alpha/beta fold hydrolase [Arthrobacter sp. AL05]MDI3277362.1 alpha/beta fold hydrolase [Arthrobacter sp. AL08]MDJ0352873.1 alpha/beta fold hydrolase [Pseudarthrobacter sp. PH31-O2]